MPRYKRNPITTEAFQIPPEGETCCDEMIEFLNSSNADLESPGDGSLLITQGAYQEEAVPGDWLYKKNKFIFILDDGYFQRNYSLIVEKKSDD